VGTDTIAGTYPGDAGHASSVGTTTLTVTGGSAPPTWTITLSDSTLGWSFTQTLSYNGPGASAEWIMEAPTVSDQVATLANYGTTEFDLVTIDGTSNPELVVSDGGDMVTQNGTVISSPSARSDGDAFKIAYGSVAPPAP